MKKFNTSFFSAMTLGLMVMAAGPVACGSDDETNGDGDSTGDGDGDGDMGDGDMGDGDMGDGDMGDGDGDMGGTTGGDSCGIEEPAICADFEPADSCECPAGTDDLGQDTCGLSGDVTSDLHLTSGCDYFLDGNVVIGGDNEDSAELLIDPGVVILAGDKDFLQINRGSTIVADGCVDYPIVMTSVNAADYGGDGANSSDWGGLVINGNATTNNGEDVEGEADSGFYGGTDDDDNSGSLRFVRVEFGGNLVDDQNELNGIAFQGVGSGTTVDYVQVHAASDDGIEFFGGTVSAKHVLITASDDDSIDWTGGWSGNIQFLAVQQWDGSGDKGIEADSNGDDNAAMPRANPTISNATLWSNQSAEAGGPLFREGTSGSFHNFAIGGFPAGCISTDGAHDSIEFSNIVVDTDCDPAQYGGDIDVDPTVEDLDLMDATSESAPDFRPASGSALLGAGEAPSDAWFDDADYIGAFDADCDWTSGWASFPTE